MKSKNNISKTLSKHQVEKNRKQTRETYPDQTTENQQQRENHLINQRKDAQYRKKIFLKTADILLGKKYMPEDSETFGISAERKNKCVSLEFYASENTLKKTGKIKLKEKKK